MARLLVKVREKEAQNSPMEDAKGCRDSWVLRTVYSSSGRALRESAFVISSTGRPQTVEA